MSWSEVKKINSDLSKPLDTLISEKTLSINSDSDVPLNDLIVYRTNYNSLLIKASYQKFGTSSNGKTVTLISINGKGFLKNVIMPGLYMAAGTPTYLKITIDGEIYYYICAKNTTSGQAYDFALNSYCETQEYSDIISNYVDYTIGANSSDGYIKGVASPGNTLQTLSNSYTGRLFCDWCIPFTEEGIRFDSSLKIEMTFGNFTRDGLNLKYYIFYELL